MIHTKIYCKRSTIEMFINNYEKHGFIMTDAKLDFVTMYRKSDNQLIELIIE